MHSPCPPTLEMSRLFQQSWALSSAFSAPSSGSSQALAIRSSITSLPNWQKPFAAILSTSACRVVRQRSQRKPWPAFLELLNFHSSWIREGDAGFHAVKLGKWRSLICFRAFIGTAKSWKRACSVCVFYISPPLVDHYPIVCNNIQSHAEATCS